MPVTFLRLGLLPIIGLSCGLTWAATADDCIAEYESMKAMFDQSPGEPLFECIRLHQALNFFGTGTPVNCTGQHEDEWHLEARSVLGNPGHCSIRLRGDEGCEADLIEYELDTPEAAQWQNFLMSQCRELGTIRGLGNQDSP